MNFSQIPDGLKTTLGWMADFMMRGEAQTWDPALQGKKPGLLLFDEVEGFLHPLWQRRLLPAMREALPETQCIVTSHSPFVISSCSQAIIDILRVKNDGTPYVAAPLRPLLTTTSASRQAKKRARATIANRNAGVVLRGLVFRSSEQSQLLTKETNLREECRVGREE